MSTITSHLNRPIVIYQRWMIRRDMPDVETIECKSFEFPWQSDDFIRVLTNRNCIGMVAEHDERVVGYMIYELHRNRLYLLNFAVHPDHQRCGVGTQMIEKLIGKLSPQRRSRIDIEVRETNLSAQLFFRQMRFHCTHTMSRFYADTDEDAYAFCYLLV